MAGISDLKKKCGLEEARKPPEASGKTPGPAGGPVRPPERDPVVKPPDPGKGPMPGGFGGEVNIPKRDPVVKPPDTGKGTMPGGFGGEVDIPKRDPVGKTSDTGKGTMPGTFGGGGWKSPVPVKPTGGVPEVRTGGGLRALLDRLPPLWGVDLALAAASLAGLVYIALHWSAILTAIAYGLYRLAAGALWLSVFLGIGVAALYWLRGRRRW